MVAELVALVIFVIMFLLIVLDRIPRQWVTLGCGALMLVLVFGVCMHDGGAIWDTLNLSAFGQSTFWYGASESSGGINWSTIVFIAGMMVMVEGMGHVGIFRWLCLKLAKAVHYRTVPLLVCFMVMAAVLSMFIDSITVILFLAAVTAELGRTLRFDPVPMILAEIFCANLGGSATMCGDPPNIIIGTSLGLTFFDFLTNTGVIMLICLVATVVYFYFCFRRILRESESQRPTDITYPDAASAITDRRGLHRLRRRVPAGGGAAGHPRTDGADGGHHRLYRRRIDGAGHPLHLRRPCGSGAVRQGGLPHAAVLHRPVRGGQRFGGHRLSGCAGRLDQPHQRRTHRCDGGHHPVAVGCVQRLCG